MKKYPIKPEIVILAGINDNIEKFRIPEVKIRMNRGKLFEYGQVTSAIEANNVLKKVIGNMVQTQEMGVFVYLDRANNVLGYYKHTVGGTAGTIFDIKLIMAGAVKSLAHGIIACHNHPSGNLKPSDADKRLTKQLKEAANVHDINLLDHIIVTKNGFFSFSEEGLNGLHGLNGTDTVINVQNYFDEIKKIKIASLPETLKQSHEYMVENADLYSMDATIDETIDLHLLRLNEYLQASGNNNTEKQKTKVKREIKRPKKEKAPKKERPIKVDDKEYVMYYDDDLKIIKRLVSLLDKSKPIRIIENLLKYIQKAITEERVTKSNSNYHELIQTIYQGIIGAISKATKENAETIILQSGGTGPSLRAKEIVKKMKIYDSVKLVKQYIQMQGSLTKEKAQKLYGNIEKALKNFPNIKYESALTMIMNECRSIIDGNKEQIITPVQLHGLVRLNGQKKKESPQKKENSQDVISASDFAEMEFETLGLTGEWKELLGNVSIPFIMMSYGKPGNGKSTFNILLARYFASEFNKKVLFVAKEEGTGYTLHEKFKRLKAFHPNIFVTSNLPEQVVGYDFVFIDSVNEMKLTPEDLQKMRIKNPKISFVYVFKSTKDGNFRGSQDFEHDVDISVKIENGFALTEKSRFGGSGFMMFL